MINEDLKNRETKPVPQTRSEETNANSSDSKKEAKRIASKKLDISGIASRDLMGMTVKYLMDRYIDIDDEVIHRYTFELRTVEEYFEKIYQNGYCLIIPMYDPAGDCRSVKIRKINIRKRNIIVRSTNY